MIIMIIVAINITPPPISQTIYFMDLGNGKHAQYDINGKKNCIINGTLTKDTLMWKQGLEKWIKVSEMPEVNNLFISNIVPPPLKD